MDERTTGSWRRVADLSLLDAAGKAAVRVGSRQVALFRVGDRVFACDNRCPHEGYPLTEGHVAGGRGADGGDGACLLTCNWHNWKFDLADGRAVLGGDDLTVYPATVRDGGIYVDLTGPSAADRMQAALKGIRASVDRHEYGRMARELARLDAAGGDLTEALRQIVRMTASRFEYGTTHAVPAAADWLTLGRAFANDRARVLTAVLEAVGHFAWDARREPPVPFPNTSRPFAEAAFLAALEAEDEEAACAIAKGAVQAGLSYDALAPVLARAALAHYQDFGHSLIYVYKTGQLVEALGPEGVYEPLLLMLVRSLALATREDLIPQFRAYGEVLAAAGPSGTDVPASGDLRAGRLRPILEAVAGGLGRPLDTYDAVMEAASWQMLHFDTRYQDHTDLPLSKNVGWLSFTHALTFGNAVRATCTRVPELWPRGLLQMGCFLGRNAGFVDPDLDGGAWAVADGAAFLEESRLGLFDHGQFEYVVAAHLVKLVQAMAEERAARPDAPWLPLGLAAVKRFLNAPLKRKHALRTARQAIDFVAGE
ncbi:MAG: hypothetical protein COW30_08185 [Rhodospirillales bacterium CG15_BIG_FIL_POST_REV_8_21_14_020_66_15]|nr:MAG: hypothetical protein COW30_08185 [Rhodospirillales bacterium CG15_BIG_FIL_POST_REV_8_21_14_020_66_15]